MLPYLAGRPVNLHRFPDGIDEAGLLAQGSALARAGVDHPLAERRRRPGRDQPSTSCSTRPRRWRGPRTTARSRCTRGPRRAKTPHQPTWAMIDIDPGEDELVRRRARARSTAPHRAGAPRRAGDAEGDRAARAADLGARGRSATRSTTRARGSRSSRARSAQPVPDLVSWEWEVAEARRQGAARLHPERDQQDARRSVQPQARAGRARVGADHVGRARRSRPAARPLDDRRRSGSAWPPQAIRSHR